MDPQLYRNQEMTLLDLLDGIIDKGAVVSGELVISVADIDLIYIDLKLLVTSFATAFGNRKEVMECSGKEVLLYETDTSGS
jgi:hypothetical protein